MRGRERRTSHPLVCNNAGEGERSQMDGQGTADLVALGSVSTLDSLPILVGGVEGGSRGLSESFEKAQSKKKGNWLL